MFSYITLITLLLLFHVSDTFSRRMVSNGKLVAPESFPYIAELYIVWPDRKILCTGSLLSRSIMMTAAHCMVDEKTKKQLGKVKKVIFRQDRGRSYATWVSGKIHGMLKISDLEEKEGILDYALFELDKPLPVCRARNGRVFSIIKLPVKDIGTRRWKTLQPSKELLDQCSLFGYGASEKGGPDGKLRKLTNISVWEVNGRLLIPMENNAQYIRQGRICGGDSGGPFVCGTDFGERIYGILSHSEPLLESHPSSCYGEENAFLYDVMGDVRKMLPYIQDSFAKMNKTTELIEDYARCDF
uniref:Peptidase S1 domain-containing protein n=2 Tax=Wuchereria bancrofti TaxID=6293 RepID=A0AAF5PP81_WUCBA